MADIVQETSIMADIVQIDGSGQPSAEGPDAHGQAALMLAESMLHSLVEAGAFTVDDALSAIATACEVKEQIGEESNEAPARILESISLLGQIATSFEADAT